MSTNLPPTIELFTIAALVERHASLFTISRLKWALRNRIANGLSDTKAVFESRAGELLIWEPRFLEWFLGLTGRNLPRSGKRQRKTAFTPRAPHIYRPCPDNSETLILTKRGVQ
jgi:hypothetical protein